MKQIWKYPLTAPVTRLDIKWSAKPLFVGMQRGEPFVWFEVDTDTELLLRRDYVIKMVVTGQEFNGTGCEYIGSFMTDVHNFVDHVYLDKNNWKRGE